MLHCLVHVLRYMANESTVWGHVTKAFQLRIFMCSCNCYRATTTLNSLSKGKKGRLPQTLIWNLRQPVLYPKMYLRRTALDTK